MDRITAVACSLEDVSVGASAERCFHPKVSTLVDEAADALQHETSGFQLCALRRERRKSARHLVGIEKIENGEVEAQKVAHEGRLPCAIWAGDVKGWHSRSAENLSNGLKFD